MGEFPKGITMTVKFLPVTITTVSSSSPQASTPSTARRPSVTKWIIVFILRIVVLTGFGAGAIALGLLSGHLVPRINPSPPLFLRLFEKKSAKIAIPKPAVNETVAQLTPEEKAAIETEIKGIREQLQVLEGRTQKLESELDLATQSGDLAVRLTNLTELLSADPKVITPPTEAEPQTSPNNLKITLPSNVLFSQGGQLSPDADEILDAIAIDLQQTKSKTITIAGHHFASGEVKAEELSFQQAQAVKVYLAKQVPGNYRWIMVGYGASRPLATDNIQANQRIEIIAE